MNPADLGVLDAAGALGRRELSSRELTEACLERIRERDGTHSHDGDPDSINAWVRVYEDDARASAAAADERLAAGEAPVLCGVPIGLKDLYGVAGKPLTASSTVLADVPERDCDVWARLRAEGMVLLGHLHTHEFACGGTTDQVGNPWALERSAGGSSGGSSAALASRQVAAATGTDTAGSLRIPSSECGTSTIKPTHGLVSQRGIVPLAPTFDHPGPMTRAVRDCEPLLAAMAPATLPEERRPLRRWALSPRIGDLDPDVAEGLERALAALPGERIEPPPPAVRLDVLAEFFDLVLTEWLVWHRRFESRWGEYRYSNRARLEAAVERAMTAEEYIASQERRREDVGVWLDWLAEHRLDAIVEPTLPIVAPVRGHGYDEPFGDLHDLSLTHYWDWTGFPVVVLPSGVGSRTGLPVSVSLIGAPGAEWDLLAWGAGLQDELGDGVAAVIDPAAVQAIDVHVHTESTRDGHDPMPPELRNAAKRYFKSDEPLPTVDDVAAYYRERGLACVLFTVDWESKSGIPPIPNEEILDAAAENPDVVIPFVSVDPARPDAVERARALAAAGARGFKFHPNLQAFFPDDRAVYPLYEVIAEAGVPALFHSGHSGIGTGVPGGGGLRLKYSNPMCLDDVAADFPELQIVLAHPSFPWQDEAISICLHKENVWIDLSGWSPKYFPPQLVQYANTQLKNKVLFGSDFPLITPERWLADFAEAPFKDEVRPLVLKENAVRLLGLG